MATSENVGSVSDMRLAAATEEIDQVSLLHRRGIGVGSILRVPCDGITGPQTSQAVTNAMFKRIGSQTSRA
jgi:hypothetical protein